MKPAFAAIFLLVISGVLRAQPGYGAPSLHEQLVGTWRLVSSTQRLSDGTLRPDPQTGAHGKGYLIYSDTGHVSAVVANPDRPRWHSPEAPTSEELRTAFEGLVAYCGTFEVNETGHFVVHHVEVDRTPNLSGAERKRFCSVQGKRLVLRPAPPLPVGVAEWTIIWERVGK